jgi:Lrp/AsnC family transcriptional regulator
MSGDVDYIIKIMVPSINAYDDVYQKIIERVEISNVSSYFAMQELKNTTVLPLNY